MILARATALLRMPIANAKLVDVDRRLATVDSSMENISFEFDAYFAFGHNMLRLCLDFGSPHHL